MRIESTRFGALDIDAERIIGFPSGLIGFPEEHEFVLVHHGHSGSIAWLQSAKTPTLALPVVGAHEFSPLYPDVPLTDAAKRAGLDGSPDDMTALVVLCANPGTQSTVNLAAPIIVDASKWRGAQVILEGTRFSTREAFVTPQRSEEAPAAAVGG
jgi:flagellar assembly factor FliW